MSVTHLITFVLFKQQALQTDLTRDMTFFSGLVSIFKI